MQFRKSQDEWKGRGGAVSRGHPAKFRGGRILGCLIALAVAMAVSAGQQNSTTPPGKNPDKPYLLPEANRLPDANDQMEMRDQQGKQQNYSAANVERRKQIADDSAKLLKLATDLKTEVDKTTKDTLSLGVIRKADEIEKLAHNVKEKMKLTVGAS